MSNVSICISCCALVHGGMEGQSWEQETTGFECCLTLSTASKTGWNGEGLGDSTELWILGQRIQDKWPAIWGFPKMDVHTPKSSILYNRIFHYKPSLFYSHFRKPHLRSFSLLCYSFQLVFSVDVAVGSDGRAALQTGEVMGSTNLGLVSTLTINWGLPSKW